jgi:hypothetical protein
MAANGISTLATKQARQEAKLALAAARRAANPTHYTTAIPNVNLLPAKYVGNIATDTDNILLPGRPWTY